MAVQRLNLLEIESAILEETGYAKSANAPWRSSDLLYKRINEYMQALPRRLNTAAMQMAASGVLKPTDIPVHMPMWKTSATSATSGTGLMIEQSSSTAYLPVDFDAAISCYDVSGKRPITIVDNADQYLDEELTQSPPGPPRVLVLSGYALQSTTWRRSGTLYPSTQTGVTPSVRLVYYRLPAITRGTSPTSEYPDLDPKWESVVIYGPACALVRNIGFEFERLEKLEQETLAAMCLEAARMA